MGSGAAKAYVADAELAKPAPADADPGPAVTKLELMEQASTSGSEPECAANLKTEVRPVTLDKAGTATTVCPKDKECDDDSQSSTSSESNTSKTSELPLVAQWYKQLYYKEKEEKDRLQRESEVQQAQLKTKDQEIDRLRAQLGLEPVAQPSAAAAGSSSGGLKARRGAVLSSVTPLRQLPSVPAQEQLVVEEVSSSIPLRKVTHVKTDTDAAVPQMALRQRRMSDPCLWQASPSPELADICTSKVAKLDEPEGPKRRAGIRRSSVW
eukprot:gb/GFBE01077992.1/.p1 GENE.gb/GFBE01077992.1/~~gb/GFBE01077992.1/.p1  ORF type:complete len:267 (+),score=63.01 gb/GFBE01077992.1/:1-801(+)